MDPYIILTRVNFIMEQSVEESLVCPLEVADYSPNVREHVDRAPRTADGKRMKYIGRAWYSSDIIESVLFC
jgi:hypothetical protein